MTVDLRLRHHYDCEIRREVPPTEVRRFACAGRGYADEPQGSRPPGDGLIVRVFPEGQEFWTALFEFGEAHFRGVTGVFSYPDPDVLCVVSRGCGHLVDARCGQSCNAVRSYPIREVHFDEAGQRILFVSLDGVACHDRRGESWRTERIGLDRLSITDVTEGRAYGWFLTLEDRQEGFSLDLETGELRCPDAAAAQRQLP